MKTDFSLIKEVISVKEAEDSKPKPPVEEFKKGDQVTFKGASGTVMRRKSDEYYLVKLEDGRVLSWPVDKTKRIKPDIFL